MKQQSLRKGCEDAINALPPIQTSFLSASAKTHKKALAALKDQLEDFKQPSSVSAPSSSSSL